MEKMMKVLQVIVPILVCIGLGMLARKRNMLTATENKGLQNYVVKFGLPCVLFNSCLGADLGAGALSSMVMVFPLMLVSSLGAFYARKKRFHYHNLPMLFSAQESGMLGIPLYMILFGADQAYRMGVLDMTQSLVCIPVIAILASGASEKPGVAMIIKNVLRSPLLLMSLLGLTLNLSGIIDSLNAIGIDAVITQTTNFIAQPVSAVMLFSVGYSFSIGEGNRSDVLKIAGIHFTLFAVFCVIIQLGLLLSGDVAIQTRWAVLLFCMLPASYLSTGLARTEEEASMSSAVCSLLTVTCLTVFCVMAVILA